MVRSMGKFMKTMNFIVLGVRFKIWPIVWFITLLVFRSDHVYAQNPNDFSYNNQGQRFRDLVLPQSNIPGQDPQGFYTNQNQPNYLNSLSNSQRNMQDVNLDGKFSIS